MLNKPWSMTAEFTNEFQCEKLEQHDAAKEPETKQSARLALLIHTFNKKACCMGPQNHINTETGKEATPLT